MEKFKVYKIIRSDGEQLIINEKEIFLKAENSFIPRADINSTDVDFVDADGGEMVAQVFSPFTQDLAGLIIPRGSSYWMLYTKLSNFFKLNFYYTIIYKKRGGGMMAHNKCWLSGGLQINVRADETFAEWSAQFKIGAPPLVEYAENEDGTRKPANNVRIALATKKQGGEVWVENGLLFDEVGEVWEAGEGGPKIVNFSGSRPIYPVLVVHGPAKNPVIINNTTNTSAKYNGVVGAGQVLRVDFENGKADIGSAVVTRFIEGEIKAAVGDNVFTYSADNVDAPAVFLEWDTIIG